MLWTPAAAHAELQANLPATPVATGEGTVVTASGSINTKGSWAQLIAATNYETQWVALLLSNTAASGSTPAAVLLDIGIGGAGSEQVILFNLLASAISPLQIKGSPREVIVPLRIPKGARVAARCQSSTASKTVDVAIFLIGGPSNVSWPGIVGADDYGTDTATSKGTAHTPGATGTESAWASVGGTTSKPYKGVFLLVGASAASAMLGRTYHFELGIGSATLAEYVFVGQDAEAINGPYPPLPLMRSIPTGTQLQVRAESQGTAEALDVALYGLY